MSTNINISVGDSKLLDQARLQQNASRQAQLEKEANKRLSNEAEINRVNALAAQGKDANGNIITAPGTGPKPLRDEPAAQRSGGIYEVVLVPTSENPTNNYPAQVKNAKVKPVVFVDRGIANNFTATKTSFLVDLDSEPAPVNTLGGTAFKMLQPSNFIPAYGVNAISADFPIDKNATTKKDFTVESWFYMSDTSNPGFSFFHGTDNRLYPYTWGFGSGGNYQGDGGQEIEIRIDKRWQNSVPTEYLISIRVAYPNTVLTYTYNVLTNGSNWTGFGGADTRVLTANANPVLADQTWYHFAWCRKGSTNSLFLDGAKLVDFQDTGGGSTYVPYLNPETPRIVGATAGSGFNDTSTQLINYIADFRLIKKCLYTDNFTPTRFPVA